MEKFIDFLDKHPIKSLVYLVFTIFLLIGTFIFSGSFIKTSEGEYFGKSVQVQWKGLIFKSCEVTVQMGEQSSKMGYCSSFNQNVCNQLKQLVGQNKTYKFENTLTSGFTRSTPCLIKEIK